MDAMTAITATATMIMGVRRNFSRGGDPKCEARSAEHAKARSAEPRRREAPSQFGGEGFGEGVSLSPLPKKILLIDISNGAI